MKNKEKTQIYGITLVALVVTVVVLLILAGITIVYVFGDNGVFGQASKAKIQTELGKIEERAQMIYSDKLMENTSSSLNTKVETGEVISQLISEGYNNIKKKTKGGIAEISLDEESMTIGLGKTAEIHINYKDTTGSDLVNYYVEVQGKYYEMHSNKGFITIDREASTLTKADFENGEEGTTSNITVISSKPEVATAKLKESINTIEVTALNVEGSTEITVTYGSFEPLKCTVTVVELEIEESKAFSRENGVIDIVWLDTENNVISEPISPANYLGKSGETGGLTAIKYDGTKWVKADEGNKKNADGKNDWYNYVAQTGNTETGGTSQWANAVANFEGKDEEKAYFVWIPRYAYKITYFDTPTNAEAYRANSNSKIGIIGYSNIKGIVDVSKGTEKLVKGTEPNNVTGVVKTAEYADYIPHPAFQFGEGEEGTKAGIWIGKFESSGSISAVRIIPNISSLRNVTVSQIFTACQGVKDTYDLKGDSHMMKNIEWGAVSYLAESKYGRNGTEIEMNSSNFTTGEGSYESKVTQSTTGNIYGIYDMNGTSWEYVAGYVNNSNLSSNGYNTDLINAVNINPKYADVYSVGVPDNATNNYSNSKEVKGDAVFETSTTGSNSTSWHSDYSGFPSISVPVFVRGR